MPLLFMVGAARRTWTAEKLYRHGLRDDDRCALCGQSSETVDHVLPDCVFSREFWFRFLRHFDWQQFIPDVDARIVDWRLTTRKRIAKLRRKAFDSVMLVGSWSVWLERNACTFSSKSEPQSCSSFIVELGWSSGQRCLPM
jgi:hypothetical protein